MRIIGIVLIGFGLLSACSSNQTAGDAAVQGLNDIQRGNWEARYTTLHPDQRVLVDHDVFVRCVREKQKNLVVSDISVIKIERVPDELLPGTNMVWDSWGVTIQFTLNGRPVKDLLNEYSISGRWYWSTTADAMAAYTVGKCP